MAQFRLSVQDAISRNKGQSVVAKAAYNARMQLDNERFGEKTANYGRGEGRSEILMSGMFVDPKLGAPVWVQDRNALWNAATAAETRKDAREGQEIILNLPYELTQKQREYMLTDFVRELVRGTARVADVNMHRASTHGDDRNIHAHILLTVRELTPNGFTGKRLEIDEAEINRLREKWAERGARELRKAGFDLEADRWKVGHFSKPLQKEVATRRGDHDHIAWCERAATKHRGVAASAMERKGQRTDRGNLERKKLGTSQGLQKLKTELREINRQIREHIKEQERETRGGGKGGRSSGRASGSRGVRISWTPAMEQLKPIRLGETQRRRQKKKQKLQTKPIRFAAAASQITQKAPKRPNTNRFGKGELYEYYKRQGKLDVYFQLFPSG